MVARSALLTSHVWGKIANTLETVDHADSGFPEENNGNYNSNNVGTDSYLRHCITCKLHIVRILFFHGKTYRRTDVPDTILSTKSSVHACMHSRGYDLKSSVYCVHSCDYDPVGVFFSYWCGVELKDRARGDRCCRLGGHATGSTSAVPTTP